MTKREFLEAIVDAETLEVELRKFAAKELEKMDKALEKRNYDKEGIFGDRYGTGTS